MRSWCTRVALSVWLGVGIGWATPASAADVVEEDVVQKSVEESTWVLIVRGVPVPPPQPAVELDRSRPAPPPARSGPRGARATPEPVMALTMQVVQSLKVAMDPIWAPVADLAGRTLALNITHQLGGRYRPSHDAELIRATAALRAELAKPYVVVFAEGRIPLSLQLAQPNGLLLARTAVDRAHRGFDTLDEALAYAKPAADAWNQRRDDAKKKRDARPLDPATFTYGDMAERFGFAKTMEQFELSLNVTEFRIELLNHYTRERIRDNPPRLWEVTWAVEHAKGNLMTVWYDVENKPVHHLFHNVGDEF